VPLFADEAKGRQGRTTLVLGAREEVEVKADGEVGLVVVGRRACACFCDRAALVLLVACVARLVLPRGVLGVQGELVEVGDDALLELVRERVERG